MTAIKSQQIAIIIIAAIALLYRFFADQDMIPAEFNLPTKKIDHFSLINENPTISDFNLSLTSFNEPVVLCSKVFNEKEFRIEYYPHLQDKIDINRAGLNLLEILPGIGPVIARNIILHREKYGHFHSPTDLLKVKGVNQSLLEKCSPWLIGFDQ